MILLNETLHLQVAIGGMLSIFAVYLINTSRKISVVADSFSETS